MVAQIGRRPRWEMQRRHEQRQLPSCLAQPRQVRAAGHQDAHAVQQQPDAHPRPGLVAQPVDHRLAEAVAADEEGAQVDGDLRRVDGGQQCLAGLLAVCMHVQVAVARRRGLAERHDGVDGPAVGAAFPGWDGQCARRRTRQLAGAEQQECRQRQVGQQQNEQHPGHRRHGMPPLAQHVRVDDVDEHRHHGDQSIQRQPVDEGHVGEHGAHLGRWAGDGASMKCRRSWRNCEGNLAIRSPLSPHGEQPLTSA
ncbi:hypothetical protein D9M71_512610 [compost metagenome]